MSDIVISKEDLKRKAFLVKCKDKEALRIWVKTYFNVDLPPDAPVDPDSTTTPLDLLWEVYEAMESGDPEKTRFLFYAARDSGKTLASSIIELLAVLHFRRDVAHLAAVLSQSQVCARYIKQYTRLPIVRDFIIVDNERTIEIGRYKHLVTGEVISVAEFKELSPAERVDYEEQRNWIKVLVATLQGTNSTHAQILCVDGDTKLMVTDGHERSRKKMTARAVFNRCLGREPSGRSVSGEHSIDAPSARVEVMSLNMDTGDIEFKPVTHAHKTQKDTLEIIAGKKKLICTHDHPVFAIGRGFTMAKDLRVGDRLVTFGKFNKYDIKTPAKSTYESNCMLAKETSRWEQVLLGSLLGDCGIYRGTDANGKKYGTPYIREQHCLEQANYSAWKKSILSEKLRLVDVKNPTSGYTGEQLVGFYSGHSPLLAPYLNIRENLSGAEKLDALGLAVWYMDDGCADSGFRLSTEGFLLEQNHTLCGLLKEKFGIVVEPHSYSRNGKVYYYLRGGVEQKRRLVEIVLPYIHPDMAYKFDLSKNTKKCELCGNDFWFYELGGTAKVCESVVCRGIQQHRLSSSIVSSIRENGTRWVYDFTVQDNNNFVSNGLLSKNCIDELDIAPRGPIEEAKMIPTQCIDGKPPIVLMTSSRKFGAGFPVQDEIDAAGERGTLVRHWNLIDVTNRCDESRSLSDRPMIPIYYSDETLRRISEEEFLAMNVDQQRGFKKDMGYEGCLKNCRMFAACRSRLARRPFRKCRFLKPVAHVQTMFRSVDLDKAKAQLLCWKPSSHGMIYPRFDPFVHVVTAQQMAKMMTGDDNHGNITKAELVALAKTINLPFYAGLDHGFTHDFAVVTGIKDGSRLFVIDVISEPELELDQKIQTCSNQIGELDPIIFADPEDPASNKTLSRHFRLREWTKTPGSVVGGINIVRFKLNPTMGTLPQLYFLKDDPGVQKLISDMQKYHWALDSAGELTDQPDETLGMEDGRPVGDDRLDALRYMVMNVFPPKKKDGITISQDTSPVVAPAPKQYSKNDWMTTVIVEHTGMAPEEPAVHNGTKGGKFWTM